MAMDRSLRTVDVYGKMHVESSNISKATVSPYRGAEIPNSQALGLDPSRVYMLLRDPEELARAAPTFNNLPLLSKHVPVFADDHQPDIVVGSTGTDSVFESPYLKNSLVIWAAGAINGVETAQQCEISCAYGYTADMAPGVYEGVAYDGVMRDLKGNHVALVEVGRAGPDVVVADSDPFHKDLKMKFSRTALAVSAALGAYIRPKLATDAKMPDFLPLLSTVKKSNLKPAEVAAKVKGLAQDIDITAEELGEVIENASNGVTDDLPAVDDADPMSKLMAFLAGKLSDEDMASAKALCGGTPAADELPEPSKKDDDMKIDKPAMDAAIEKVKADQKAIRQAEKDVFPFVGEIVAQDSAEAIYKIALDAAKVDTSGMEPSAYKHVLLNLPKPGAAIAAPKGTLAQDAATGLGDFKGLFPTAGNIKRS